MFRARIPHRVLAEAKNRELCNKSSYLRKLYADLVGAALAAMLLVKSYRG
jgi:hypothetical protein